MKSTYVRRALLQAVAVQSLLLGTTAGWSIEARADVTDVLAITDDGLSANPGNPATLTDDSVKFFEAKTGRVLAAPKVGPAAGLVGPAAILFPDGPKGGFLVVNQNQFQPVNGEVRRYDAGGTRVADIVLASDPKGPLGPRGAIVVGNGDGTRTLFVADQGDIGVRGQLLAYTLRGNALTNGPINLDPHLKNGDGTAAEYHPRAVVLGPDGLLYVSQLANLGDGPPSCGGSILRFDLSKRTFKDVLVENPSLCKENINDLHRPEGIVFSPRGDLYITSFRQRTFDPGDSARVDDNDRVLIIQKRFIESKDSGTGSGHKSASLNDPRAVPVEKIDLWRADQQQERAFAQALLFGPGDNLFVPISNTGEVRRYDVDTRHFWTFIPARTGGLTSPQYLSFGKTDPATLGYDNKR
jgi:hypothetical protein